MNVFSNKKLFVIFAKINFVITEKKLKLILKIWVKTTKAKGDTKSNFQKLIQRLRPSLTSKNCIYVHKLIIERLKNVIYFSSKTF